MIKTLNIPDDWIPVLPQQVTYAGEIAVVTGYGLNSITIIERENSKFSRIGMQNGLLRFTNVTIISSQDCMNAWNGKNGPDKIICAKTSSPDALCDVSLKKVCL